MIYINKDKKECKIDGNKEDLLLDFSYIYCKLREKISRDLIEHYIKNAEEVYNEDKRTKVKIKKIEIDAKTYEEACKQIDRLIIPENIKEYIKKNI